MDTISRISNTRSRARRIVLSHDCEDEHEEGSKQDDDGDGCMYITESDDTAREERQGKEDGADEDEEELEREECGEMVSKGMLSASRVSTEMTLSSICMTNMWNE
jgi:hypothetical protein